MLKKKNSLNKSLNKRLLQDVLKVENTLPLPLVLLFLAAIASIVIATKESNIKGSSRIFFLLLKLSVIVFHSNCFLQAFQ